MGTLRKKLLHESIHSPGKLQVGSYGCIGKFVFWVVNQQADEISSRPAVIPSLLGSVIKNLGIGREADLLARQQGRGDFPPALPRPC